MSEVTSGPESDPLALASALVADLQAWAEYQHHIGLDLLTVTVPREQLWRAGAEKQLASGQGYALPSRGTAPGNAPTPSSAEGRGLFARAPVPAGVEAGAAVPREASGTPVREAATPAATPRTNPVASLSAAGGSASASSSAKLGAGLDFLTSLGIVTRTTGTTVSPPPLPTERVLEASSARPAAGPEGSRPVPPRAVPPRSPEPGPERFPERAPLRNRERGPEPYGERAPERPPPREGGSRPIPPSAPPPAEREGFAVVEEVPEDPNQVGLFAAMQRTRPRGVQEIVAPFAGPPPLDKAAAMEELREELGECIRCSLSNSRSRLVYGEGDLNARVLFVGDAPGLEEDAIGNPMTGEAGKLFDKILETMLKVKRSQIYLTNTVLCSPPPQRPPSEVNLKACQPILDRVIGIVRPKLIVALGPLAVKSLFVTVEPLVRMRGFWFQYRGIPVMPTFHPRSLLQDSSQKRPVKEDMEAVMAKLSGRSGG